MTKKPRQKPKYLIFKGLSVAKNCLRPESAPLITVTKKETSDKKFKYLIFLLSVS